MTPAGPAPAAPTPRTLPLLEPETAFFWTAGAQGHLLIQCCTVCARFQHPPLPLCPACRSEAMAPRAVSGKGAVKAFTINHQPWLQGMDVPFAFAAIELDEQPGLYVMSNVLGPLAAIEVGMRVEVVFEPVDDIWLPLFRQEGAGA